MKKVYLVAATLLIGGAISAQHTANIPLRSADHQLTQNHNALTKESNVQLKAAGDILYSEDFANGLTGNAGGTMTLPGSTAWTTTGPDAQWWVPADSCPDGAYTNPTTQTIESTTSANGFMAFATDSSNTDWSDPQNPVIDPGYASRDGQLVSPVIDITGYTNLVISFEQWYRHCCDNTHEYYLELSTDGFTSEIVQIECSNRGSLPYKVDVNDNSGTRLTKIVINNYLSGLATPANFQFRFNHVPTASHYFWQVDDVALIEQNSTDVRVNSRRYAASGNNSLEYPLTPVSQITTIDFGAWVENIGQSTTTSTLDIEVNDGSSTVFTGSGTPVSQTTLQADSLTAGTWTPAGLGDYEIEYIAGAGAADDDMNDNSLFRYLTVNQYIYGRDEGGMDGSNNNSFISNISGGTGQQFKIGNIFDIVADDTIRSVDVVISDRTDETNQPVVFAEVYQWDGTQYVFVEQTSEYTLTSTADFEVVLTLPLYSVIPVTAGDDILVVAAHYGGDASGDDDVRFATAGNTDQGSVLGFDGSNSLFNLIDPGIPCVRLNFDPASNNVGIEELAQYGVALGQNMPNPFNNETQITYELKQTENVRFEVVDVTGKMVMSFNEGTKVAGSHTVMINANDLPAGTYFYSLITDGYKTTRSMVINK